MEDKGKDLRTSAQIFEAIEQTPYFPSVGSVADEFRVLRDKAEEEGNHELAKKAQYEIEIFCLTVKPPFINSHAKRRFGGRYGYANGTEWPDADSFADEQLSYCETRLLQTENPFLMARYADLLFDKWTKDRTLNKLELGTMLAGSMIETACAHLKQSDRAVDRFLWDVARAMDVGLTLGACRVTGSLAHGSV